jgi:HSP20 family protein
MMSLTRWNPRRDMMSLRNEMNRLFEQAFEGGSLGPWQSSTNWGLALDVAEKDDAFLVTASVPGLKPDDLDITITDNVLTIKGETKSDETIEEEQYHLRERRFGSFGRSISLPVTVDADNVEANYEDGILTLTLPKAEEARPHRIAIKAHSNGK